MGQKHSVQAFDVEKHKEKLLQDVFNVEKEIKQFEESKKREKEMREEEKGVDFEKFKKYNLHELNWPDPDPNTDTGRFFLDDVTRMNAKEVDCLFLFGVLKMSSMFFT
eukprot:TRINITY_DN36806_c0_g1_i1.p1 TRINITY_DN36806_c0_g1~~TRINITY_DN36806_c0_g1_i1.p1  ORF type:complete len:108 (+),score=30.63 TRINITY_DN36806_c0_g1_i1:100-423(+)